MILDCFFCNGSHSFVGTGHFLESQINFLQYSCCVSTAQSVCSWQNSTVSPHCWEQVSMFWQEPADQPCYAILTFYEFKKKYIINVHIL